MFARFTYPFIFMVSTAVAFSACKKSTVEPSKPPSNTATGSCSPTFPISQGWIGADGATSVEISSGKSLWIFGDSFIGTSSSQTTRAGASLAARNSIGISTCTNGVTSIQYYWGSGSSNTSPTPFFTAPTSGHWFWAGDAVKINGSIYISMMDVSSTGGGGGFGFQVNGITLATISNPDANPSSWSIQYNSITTSPGFYPGSSMTLDSSGQNLLLYTLYDGGNSSLSPKPVVLTRIPVTGLGNPAANIQYLNSSGVWTNGMPSAIASAKQIFAGGQSEFTVRFHSTLGKWVAVMTNTVAFSNHANVLTSNAAEGPWSSAVTAYTFPEMSQSGVWCYAAKEHVEFSAGSTNETTMTYVCNTTTSANLISDLSIYFPKTVKISIP